jgi:hypothetical protein
MIRLTAVLVLLLVSTIDLAFLGALGCSDPLEELELVVLELADENILLAGCKLKPELVSKRSLVRLLVRELLLELFLKENMIA